MLIKNYNLLIPRPLKRTPKLQETTDKGKHPALQNTKFLNFFKFLGVIFALLDPDPDPVAQINADPDPKPWPCTRENTKGIKEHLLSTKKRVYM